MVEQNESCTCVEDVNHWSNGNITDAIFNLIMVCKMIPSIKEHRSLSTLPKCLQAIESYKNLSILHDMMDLIQNFTNGILTDFLSTSLQALPVKDPAPYKYHRITPIESILNETMVDGLSWDNSFARKFKIVIEGYCLLFFAFVGVVGNVTGIFYILKKKRRTQFFNMMLLPLLVFDALYTFSEFVMSLDENILTFPDEYIWLYKYLFYPLRRVSMGASIFMTIALAHERLCSVNRPILQRNSFLSSSRRQHRRLAYVVPVIIAAFFINISAFWEIDIVETGCNQNPFSGNASTCFAKHPSALRVNENYSYYYVGLLRLLVFGIYPFTSLFYLNYKISQSIRFNRFRGTGVSSNQTGILRRRTVVEKRTTKVLAAIIMSFLVCHLPRVILNGMEFYILKLISTGNPPPVYVSLMSSITRLLLVSNMSLNVGYYLYFTLFTKLWLIRYYRGSKSSAIAFER